MKFARWVFLIAGILGLLPVLLLAYDTIANGEVILPDFASMGLFFYVFVFQYVCWQILYIVLASDPVRYRPVMIPSFFAKVSAPFNPIWLFLFGFNYWIPIAVVDVVFAILFLIAFWSAGRGLNKSAA